MNETATTPVPPPEPQTGGSYIRCPETGALQPQHTTEGSGAGQLRHEAAPADATPPTPAAPEA